MKGDVVLEDISYGLWIQFQETGLIDITFSSWFMVSYYFSSADLFSCCFQVRL